MITCNAARPGGCGDPACTKSGCEPTAVPLEPLRKQVFFVMMFSDEQKQDTHYVVCGETKLYADIIPEFAAHVNFSKSRYDGADCFRSNFSRLLMVLYRKWTPIEKQSGRITPPGCGKSKLDQQVAWCCKKEGFYPRKNLVLGVEGFHPCFLCLRSRFRGIDYLGAP